TSGTITTEGKTNLTDKVGTNTSSVMDATSIVNTAGDGATTTEISHGPKDIAFTATGGMVSTDADKVETTAKTSIKDQVGDAVSRVMDTTSITDKVGTNTSATMTDGKIAFAATGGEITTDAKTITNKATDSISNVTNTYGKDVKTDITGNQSTKVGGNAETEITGTSTTTVTGLTTENYNGGLTTAVTGDESHSVTGAQENTVKGTQTNKVDGAVTNTYGSDVTSTIAGNQSTTVTGDITNKAANINNTATDKIASTVSDNSITLDKDGTKVKGKMDVSDDFAVGDNFKVTAKDGSVSAAGGKFTVDADGNTEAAGNLTVEGDTVLNGGLNVAGDSYFTKSIWNDTEKNRVEINTSGIRIGQNSGQVDDDGFYAGGHTWDEAKAAIGADGRIKGANGNFTVDENGNVDIGKGNVTVDAATGDTVFANDVTVGGTLHVNDWEAEKFSVDGKTYIDKNGINANNQKITNVAPGAIGPNSTDAINGSQLYDVREDLSKDIKKVGAGAAAMANLRPLDSGYKFSLALGVGTYRSESAAAIGLFYKPTDRIQFNLSGTVGSGHNMFGGGISFALDKVVKPVGNAAANAEIKSLQAENAEIKAQLEELKAVVESMKTAAK
ncbi:MAG: YadA-like family protein, partial [Acidaminococcaceae bacterium]|nr:YadA-like family protein [Acidaminococcaceae bacterium]